MKLAQVWKRMDVQIKIPTIFLCIIVLYILVRVIGMGLLMLFGVQTEGYGGGYLANTRPNKVTTSVGTYRFYSEELKEYTARYSEWGSRKHWPPTLLITYQKGFPYNNCPGEPGMGKIVRDCVLPFLAGIALVVYILRNMRKAGAGKPNARNQRAGPYKKG